MAYMATKIKSLSISLHQFRIKTFSDGLHGKKIIGLIKGLLPASDIGHIGSL